MKKIAIAALLSAFAAVPAVAADMYVGVNASQNQTGYNNVGASMGFGILGGYSFSDSLAAELSYSTTGNATISASTGGGTASGTVTALAAVYSLPVGKDFAVKGKLGYASTTITCSQTGCGSANRSDLIYGVGAQYNANKAIGVTLSYDVAKIGDGSSNFAVKDVSMLSLGVVYKL